MKIIENTEKNPLISVIITLFAHKNTLNEALDSILQQTFQNFEIVLVENNADKSLVEIAMSYISIHPDKIRIVSEPVQGIASARTRGVIEAKGTFIAFCDEDDVMYPDKLEKQLHCMLNNPKYSIITSYVDFISPQSEIIETDRVFEPQHWAIELFGKTEKFKKHPLYNPHPSTMFFSRSLALEVGLFDEGFNPHGTEDTEFSLRMYEHGPIYLIHESLTKIRFHTSEYLKKREGEINWISIENLNHFFHLLCIRYSRSFPRRSFLNIRAQWLREISMLFFKVKNGRDYGRSLLKRSIQDRPWDLRTWKQYIRSFFPYKYYPKVFKFEINSAEKIPSHIDKKYLQGIFNEL